MASVREEIEEILVDCYGEDEQMSAWGAAFEDDVAVPFSASLLGASVEVQGFRVNDASGVQCLVVREQPEKRTRWISVEDLDEDGGPEDFRHMLALFRAWQEGGY